VTHAARAGARGAWRALLATALLIGLLPALLLAPGAARAHDVAEQLRLHAIVRVGGDGTLQVLLRVPLELLLNVDLPKRGNGYLDLARVDDATPRALQALAKGFVLSDGGRPLPLLRGETRIALPSDRAFESFERALAAVRGERLSASTDVYWNQGYYDALLEYRLESAGRPDLALDLRVAPGLRERLRLDLRLLTAGGEVRAYELSTGAGPVTLDPRWHQAAATFVRSGVGHILGGSDHLLFLLCLVLPFRRIGWPLVGVVTAFTLAHTVTLVAAAVGWVPREPAFPLLVEALIAASIVYMAIENLFAPRLQRRWLLTAGFGLVHGFGFSFGLAQELQFAGSHLTLSLLSFNLGIELGQLLALALAWPLLAWVRSRSARSARMLGIVVSVFVAHQAWHWLEGRFAALARADWPGLASELGPAAAGVALLLAALWALAHALRGRVAVAQR
jgi:hypothetical protein